MRNNSDDGHGGAKDPAITKTSQSVWGVFPVIFGIILALVALWWIIDARRDAKLKAGLERQARIQQELSEPPSAPRVVVQKVGKVPTLYKFADHPSGCFSVPLDSDFDDYPNGPPGHTKITITMPGGRVVEDEAGVDHDWGALPVGEYMFCRKDSGATGVEIWK